MLLRIGVGPEVELPTTPVGGIAPARALFDGEKETIACGSTIVASVSCRIFRASAKPFLRGGVENEAGAIGED
ncbi:hypothetical protein C7I87_24100 [Mesorhizobium sp. SARCC-RB16n]|uniref:hypothetical protein n=1 Tax=Mesorhizobium sp. SARCC-RB16n TaxID=2116687 RepID=UPI00122EA711|nr:hypothetical protein [Mesorhizobium sp. SARCC-RB16n]KAA3448026.1 hypothetical protein C7I87_24100 [Mesorhizobium sp. SARCC-RB16n]